METLCIALLIEMFHGALTSSGFVLYLTRKYSQAQYPQYPDPLGCRWTYHYWKPFFPASETISLTVFSKTDRENILSLSVQALTDRKIYIYQQVNKYFPCRFQETDGKNIIPTGNRYFPCRFQDTDAKKQNTDREIKYFPCQFHDIDGKIRTPTGKYVFSLSVLRAPTKKLWQPQ